jgi:hypothetical protein
MACTFIIKDLYIYLKQSDKIIVIPNLQAQIQPSINQL